MSNNLLIRDVPMFEVLYDIMVIKSTSTEDKSNRFIVTQ